MPYFDKHYSWTYSVNPLRIRGDFGAPSRGRMDSFRTRHARPPSSRGAPLFAKAAFAFAAIAMAALLAASVTGFDLANWIHKPASANIAGANSFVATNSSVAGTTSFDDR